MKRKALLIGIEEYQFMPELEGVINETREIEELLSQNHNGDLNYRCELLLDEGEAISRARLRNKLIEFFKDDRADHVLLYFNGHGSLKGDIGFLCTSDGTADDPGISFFELQSIALNSHHKEIVIILDCCFSGEVFQLFSQNAAQTTLRKGMAIISATRANETAEMFGGKSIFTQALIDGLQGLASNIQGEITVGSIYRYLDQLLTPARQRPQFAAYFNQGILIRKSEPALPIPIIRKIAELFKDKDHYDLSPENEPSEKHGNHQKEEEFSILQKFAKVNLVVPVGAEHMYYAAIESKTCKLTPMGMFYRKLVRNGLI